MLMTTKVQPHCMLVVFSEKDFIIQAVSENVPLFFYRASKELLGHPLSVLMDKTRMEYIHRLLKHDNPGQIPPLRFSIDREGKLYLFYLQLSRSNGNVLIEFERQPEEDLIEQLNPYAILNVAFAKLQSVKSPQELFKQMVKEMHILTGFDQIYLLRFDDEFNAEIKAAWGSNRQDPIESMWLRHTEEDDAHVLFQRPVRYVVDFKQPSVGVKTLRSKALEEEVLNDMAIQAVLPFGKRYFSKMGVSSVLLVSVQKNNQPWGVVVCLNKERNYLSYEQRKACELLCQVFSSQVVLQEEMQEKEEAAYKGNLLNTLIEAISSKSSFLEGLEQKESALLELAEAEGAVLYMGNHFESFGKVPEEEDIHLLIDWLQENQSEEIYHTDRIHEIYPDVGHYGGILSASLSSKKRQYLVWFRPEYRYNVNWLVEMAGDEGRIVTGQSEEIKEHSQPWCTLTLYYLGELRKIIVESILRTLQEEEEQNARFKYMFQNSSDIIAIFEDGGKIRYISDSAEHILGYSIDHLKCCWKDFIHPEDLDRVAVVMREVREVPGMKKRTDYRMLHSTGVYLFVESVVQNLLHEPNIQGVLVNTRDITHHVKARKRLHKFQTAIESSSNGVIIIENSPEEGFPVVYQNPRFQEITGSSTTQTLGHPCAYFIKDGVNDTEIDKLRSALKNRERTEAILKKFRWYSGEPYWCNIQLYPVMDDEEEVSNYIALITDITYSKEAEQKLKEYAERLYNSNEELQTFAYVASHDLQEPLRTISGFSELLAEIYRDQLDEEGQEYIDFILQGTNRMKSLIDDLLQFSRVSTGEEDIREVDLNKTVRVALDNLHSSIEETGTMVYCDLLPVLQMNETMVLQVFQNIISNAIKYRHKDRTPDIRVTCKELSRVWQFCIQDNGIGIEAKHLDRIFVIFQRLHTHEEFTGTGIGLAICKKIIDKYGGRIWVESEYGKGSKFCFTIPKHLEGHNAAISAPYSWA
ncbi:PAS domain S-box protein [Limibacter armeniacum]|uniref:PAS domain S-box protein n=1 Tax=Limibacter armeniacum TaxID=466084 RepID=UPI002FE58011